MCNLQVNAIALDYVEEHLDENIDYQIAAKKAGCSNVYFQRVFGILCGVTFGEYIRNRQLALAGNELISINNKIIDIALKYGYESPESFTGALSKFHGFLPFAARKNGAFLKPFSPPSVKTLLSGGSIMDFKTLKKSGVSMSKKSIIGGTDTDNVVVSDFDCKTVHKSNTDFWNTIGSEFLGVTALPSYGGFISENKLQLLNGIEGKRALEIGCGNGRSLKYVYDKGVSELWGIDISPEQIEHTTQFLSQNKIKAKLLCSPMKSEADVPKQYFDLVYSVYAIGWTTDLNKTFRNIASHLKKDGIFIFSWSHPIHKCVSVDDNKFVFSNSYFDEAYYSTSLEDKEIILSNRKLSTYINALSDNGFVIDRLIEDNDEDLINSIAKTNFVNKAKILPVTFVIKAHKF